MSAFCLLFSLNVSPARAWNATGHKIIASIAFRQLTAERQGQVVALLQRHPRFQQDFSDEMPDEMRGADEGAKNEWLFQQAAVWPDMVRGGPPEKRAFNRGEWHYINLPHFLDDGARIDLKGRITANLERNPPQDATMDTTRMNVIQVIRFSRLQIANQQSNPETRAVLLSWLFHNVGDIHQPLHSTALFSKRLFPEGDRGGNSVRTKQAGNLHSLWDQFPGQDAEFRPARNKAIALLNDASFAQSGSDAAVALDPEFWNSESHALAKNAVYNQQVLAALQRMESGDGPVETIELGESYLKAGGQISERRLVQAGFRLGAVLQSLFK